MNPTQTKNVRDVMSRFVRTCRPQDSLQDAAHILLEHDIGALPVVDDKGRVQAMITDRDICMGAFTQGLPLSELRVADSMSKTVVKCAPDAPLSDAVDAMCKFAVRRVPVVDLEGRIEGVVSLNDLILAEPEKKRSTAPGGEVLEVLTAVSQHRTFEPVDVAAEEVKEVEEVVPEKVKAKAPKKPAGAK